jgi:hypothetical protein
MAAPLAGFAHSSARRYNWGMLGASYDMFLLLSLLGPLWVPVAFVFYLIWREAVPGWSVAALALAECLSFGLFYFALRAISYAA